MLWRCFFADARGYLARKQYLLELKERTSAALVIQRGKR